MASQWSHDEIIALLEIFSDEAIQTQFECAYRNSHLYNGIADRLKEMGFIRSAQQCRTKMKNFRKQYKQIKEHNRRSSKDKKTCRYFSLLNRIWSDRPLSSPALSRVDSSELNLVLEEDDDDCELQEMPSPVSMLSSPQPSTSSASDVALETSLPDEDSPMEQSPKQHNIKKNIPKGAEVTLTLQNTVDIYIEKFLEIERNKLEELKKSEQHTRDMDKKFLEILEKREERIHERDTRFFNLLEKLLDK